MKPIKKFKGGQYVLRIYRELCPTDPRDPDFCENLGTMVCWHNWCKLGENHTFASPKEFCKEIAEDNAIILPVYMYDHSGIALNTTGFSSGWDSGQVGFIYVLKEDVIKEWGNLSRETVEIVKHTLVAEVETYSRYLAGDVYGYVLKRRGKPGRIGSCWGFYGTDFDKNGLFEDIGNEVRKDLGITMGETK